MYLGTYPCDLKWGWTSNPLGGSGGMPPLVRYFFNFGVKCINLVHFEGEIKRLYGNTHMNQMPHHVDRQSPCVRHTHICAALRSQ